VTQLDARQGSNFAMCIMTSILCTEHSFANAPMETHAVIYCVPILLCLGHPLTKFRVVTRTYNETLTHVKNYTHMTCINNRGCSLKEVIFNYAHFTCEKLSESMDNDSIALAHGPYN